MKIAILSFYGGYLERGVENWTHEVASRFVKKHKVTVFQNGPAGEKSDYKVVSTGLKVNWKAKDSRGVITRIVFVDYWSLLIARATVKMIPILYKENFDIVIPTNGGWQVAFVRILTWIRRGKMVVVGHSGRGWDDRNNLWSFPNVFVALSKSAREWAKRVNPFVKTIYIPNGIDLKLFNPKGEKANISLSKPVILAVGAPEKGKRLKLAIKAVSKLEKGSLLVLGGGYEEKRIRELGKKLLGNKFLMKNVAFEEIPKYYRASNLFTLPSWKHEAFGLVYLEAMASGIPIVATDDELRRSVVGNAGILVDPTDIGAYAKALKKALRTDWGDKPRKQAKKFSWENVIIQYENLFFNLFK
jgi:glycosyltransferase involved in cell wall biosynthesis